METTLAIIKPDAVKNNHMGEIINIIESAGLSIAAMKMVHLTKTQAEGFYFVHKERPFFQSLTTFMSEGPVVLMMLKGAGAIAKWRELMGATDPAKAAEGTIRKRFAQNIERNSVHGSDAAETARFETGYFFNGLEPVR